MTFGGLPVMVKKGPDHNGRPQTNGTLLEKFSENTEYGEYNKIPFVFLDPQPEWRIKITLNTKQ